jgi:DNA polymerase III alpha subunit
MHERLAALRELAAAVHLPLVAAGDVHMHARSRRPLQDVLTALRLKTTVAEAGQALFANGERHLRSRLALARLYPPELLAETLKSPRAAISRWTNCATSIPRKSCRPARRRIPGCGA